MQTCHLCMVSVSVLVLFRSPLGDMLDPKVDGLHQR